MEKNIPYEYKASIGLREPIKKVKPILPMWAPEDMPDAVEPFAYMDDMFFIGRADTNVIVVKTSEGLVLIDALCPANAAERYILPGLKKLGLENEKVLACIITHAHFDHFEGAEQLRALTGCKLYMSEGDSKLMVPTAKSHRQFAYPSSIDVCLHDGDKLTFGDKTFQIYETPGHSPHGSSIIFPVTDNGTPHMCGVWIGNGVPKEVASACDFVKSAFRFVALCREYNVDVKASMHPFGDNTIEKGALLKERKPGEANPFIIGTDGVAESMYYCIARVLAMIADMANRLW